MTAVAGIEVPAAPAELPAATPPGLVFRFTFERPAQRDGVVVHIPAQGGFTGTVLSADGGTVVRQRLVPDGWFARFPGDCVGGACPRAVVDIPDHPRLDPMDADFSFGARVIMRPGQTTHGSNIVQKGRFHTAGGMWKLQVDDLAGHPSCVLRGSTNGRNSPAVVVDSPVTIADGQWHEVSCARTLDAVAVVVDGQAVRRQVSVPPIANESPVHIGGSGVAPGDDQFHGGLDDVFLTVAG